MANLGPRGNAIQHPDTFDPSNGAAPARTKQIEPKNIVASDAKTGPKGLNKPPDSFSE